MTDPKVRYVRKVGGTPIQGLAFLVQQDQVERGFRDLNHYTPGSSWDVEALWIDLEGECVAILQFERYEWRRFIQTAWSYTLPEYRRHGFNEQLFEALKHIAKRDGYNSIIRLTHPSNTPMLKAFEKAGGKVRNLEYEFSIDAGFNSLNDKYEFP